MHILLWNGHSQYTQESFHDVHIISVTRDELHRWLVHNWKHMLSTIKNYQINRLLCIKCQVFLTRYANYHSIANVEEASKKALFKFGQKFE